MTSIGKASRATILISSKNEKRPHCEAFWISIKLTFIELQPVQYHAALIRKALQEQR